MLQIDFPSSIKTKADSCKLTSAIIFVEPFHLTPRINFYFLANAIIKGSHAYYFSYRWGKSIRRTLRKFSSIEGYKVERANDGLEGLEPIRINVWWCGACSILSAKMDGMEVLDKSGRPIKFPSIMVSDMEDLYCCRGGKEGASIFCCQPLI